MIVYLTYNDIPSGIYSSQVIDVVKYIRKELNKEIRLVALISIRNFFLNRKKIKMELGDAIIFPMVPGISRWRYNGLTLWLICLFFQPGIIIGRSVLATQLALKNRKKGVRIIYDGRGAISAEWEEYKVVEDKILLSQISQLEREAVLMVDFRIAVSTKLVEYWKETYDYNEINHVVIPCTLNKVFEEVELSQTGILNARRDLGLDPDDLVFVYSGSVAGWQSFELLNFFLFPILKSKPDSKVLFLAEEDECISKLRSEFPGRIICRKVRPSEVPSYLVAADFGLLIREKSITNKVASPVKFPEYLCCGLPVIISEDMGDYSVFIEKFSCGYKNAKFNSELKVGGVERKLFHKIALDNFTKSAYLDEYTKLVNLESKNKN